MIIYGRQPGRGLFYVGGVAAVRAVDDGVLAGAGGADELDGIRAAHGAIGRLGLDGRDAEALEGPLVGLAVAVEGQVELVPAEVEAVGVLHGELAGAHQAGLGPRLVTQLGLELVPHLRQLAVGLELGGEGGDDLLVGHAQGQVGAAPVLQPEHLLAHHLPAAAALPQLARVHDRHQELRAPIRSISSRMIWMTLSLTRWAGAASSSARPSAGGCTRRGAAGGGWARRRPPGRRAASGYAWWTSA